MADASICAAGAASPIRSLFAAEAGTESPPPPGSAVPSFWGVVSADAVPAALAPRRRRRSFLRSSSAWRAASWAGGSAPQTPVFKAPSTCIVL